MRRTWRKKKKRGVTRARTRRVEHLFFLLLLLLKNANNIYASLNIKYMRFGDLSFIASRYKIDNKIIYEDYMLSLGSNEIIK